VFDILGLKKAVSSLADQRARLRAEIETLQAQRESVLSAPPAKSDFKAAAAGWVASSARYYAQQFEQRMRPIIDNPQRLQEPARVGQVLCVLSAAVKSDEEPNAHAMDLALCFVFKDHLTAALESAIDRMQFGEGLPLGLRAKAVKELDGKIDELMTQESELLEAARSAGLPME
jgi:hypothetical protein